MPCFCDEKSLERLSRSDERIIIKKISTALDYLDFRSLEKKLCFICRELSIIELQACDLLEWYKNHLLKDYSSNYDNEDKKDMEFAESEAKRLGFIIFKNKSVFSIEEFY